MKLCVFSCALILFFSCSNSENQPLSPRVNHVMLYVADVDASVKFYTDAFDLQETNRVSHLTVTKADGAKLERDIEIVFLKFPGQDFVYEIVQNPNPSDSLVRGTLFQHVGVDVLDIDASLRQAIDAGGVLVVPVQSVTTKDIHVKQAFLQGPDGEMIELMQIVTGEF